MKFDNPMVKNILMYIGLKFDPTDIRPPPVPFEYDMDSLMLYW